MRPTSSTRRVFRQFSWLNAGFTEGRSLVPPTSADRETYPSLRFYEANTIFDVTGVLLRQMPFTPERARAAGPKTRAEHIISQVKGFCVCIQVRRLINHMRD